jgi:hypothetical protein
VFVTERVGVAVPTGVAKRSAFSLQAAVRSATQPTVMATSALVRTSQTAREAIIARS